MLPYVRVSLARAKGRRVAHKQRRKPAFHLTITALKKKHAHTHMNEGALTDPRFLTHKNKKVQPAFCDTKKNNYTELHEDT